MLIKKQRQEKYPAFLNIDFLKLIINNFPP